MSFVKILIFLGELLFLLFSIFSFGCFGAAFCYFVLENAIPASIGFVIATIFISSVLGHAIYTKGWKNI